MRVCVEVGGASIGAFLCIVCGYADKSVCAFHLNSIVLKKH